MQPLNTHTSTVRAAMKRIGTLSAIGVVLTLLFMAFMFGPSASPAVAALAPTPTPTPTCCKILDIGWDLGSLIATGHIGGLGNTDIRVVIEASGIPIVQCTNQGGNTSPGQNPGRGFSTGGQTLDHNNYTKNGKSPFGVTAPNPDFSGFTATLMGCANDNWTFQIVGMKWDTAVITIYDLAGVALRQQTYACVTNVDAHTVSCTAVP